MSKKSKRKNYTKVLLELIKKYLEEETPDIDILNIEEYWGAEDFIVTSDWVDNFTDYICELDSRLPFSCVEMVAEYADATSIIIIYLQFQGDVGEIDIPIIRITNAKVIPPRLSLLSVSGESTIHSGLSISGDFETLI